MKAFCKFNDPERWQRIKKTAEVFLDVSQNSTKALLWLGIAHIEIGKTEKDSDIIHGIAQFKKALASDKEMDEEKTKRINDQIRRAKKIHFLKLLGVRTARSLAETEEIRAKKNILKKLYVTQKVPKDKRTNVEDLY